MGRGSPPSFPLGGSGLPPVFLRSPQHPLTPPPPQFQAVFPFRRDTGLQSFPFSLSRPWPAALGAARAVVPGPPACGPLLPQLSPAPPGRPYPAGRSSAPWPASVPVFSAPPSQRREVGPSPWALRTAMSRGPGLEPEPRLVAEQTEDAASAAGSSACSVERTRLGQPAARRRPRAGPAPRRHVTTRYAARAAAGPSLSLARRRPEGRAKSSGSAPRRVCSN